MIKKLLIFFLLSFLANFSFANKDKYLEQKTYEIYGETLISSCLQSDYARSFKCSNTESKNFFSNVESFEACKLIIKEKISDKAVIKNIDRQIKKNSRNLIDDVDKSFETLLQYTGNKEDACDLLSKRLNKTFDDYHRILKTNDTPAYLSTIESNIILGEYANLNLFKNKEYIATLFNTEKSDFSNESFLFSITQNVSQGIFPEELQIKLWTHLKKISLFSKLRDYSNAQILRLEKKLELQGPEITDFLKNVNIDLKQFDLDSPIVLFELAKRYINEWIIFNNLNFSMYEIYEITEGYKFMSNYNEPLNRLNKLKHDLDNPIGFNFMVVLNDISTKIRIPNDITKSFFFLVVSDISRNNNKSIDEFSLRELNYLKSILNIVEGRDLLKYESAQWITKNSKYKQKYENIGIITDFEKLKKITKDFINDYQKNVSIALAEDLYLEAVKQINIESLPINGKINEFAAQDLAEQAIKTAKYEYDFQIEEDARGLISFLLMHSYNEKIRNTNLGKIHLEETLNMWIDQCKKYYSNDLILCFEQNFNKPSDSSIGNVIKLIYEDESIYDYTEYIADLYFIYKRLNKNRLEHITSILKKPKDFKNEKLFIKYLDSSYKKLKDERILDVKCDYMYDRYNKYTPDDVIECYQNIIDIGYDIKDSENTSEYFITEYKTQINLINIYKEDKFVKNDNFDIEKFFNNENIMIKKENKFSKKKYALVIGNSSYDKKLDSTISDANKMEIKFNEMGFITKKYIDLNSQDFENKIVEFGIEAKNSSQVVFYYSGHAFETGGLNYLLPIDVDFSSEMPEILATSIELNKIIKKNLPGKTKLIFLDACRNNPFNKRGLASLNLGDNTLVSFSAGANKFSYVGNDMSPYSKFLSTYIKEKTSINEILRKVRKDVKKLTKNMQIPEEYSNLEDKVVLND